MQRLIRELQAFSPCNEQERRDRETMLRLLSGEGDFLGRENNIAHLTASAWITNPAKDRVLLAYHNVYDSWAWLGGHADGDPDLLAVSMREACEESGLSEVRPSQRGIFSLEILTVDGHEKRGTYVGSHLHLNATYLLSAREEDALRAKPDENRGVAWFDLDEAIAASREPWFQARIYPKLNRKLRDFARSRMP